MHSSSTMTVAQETIKKLTVALTVSAHDDHDGQTEGWAESVRKCGRAGIQGNGWVSISRIFMYLVAEGQVFKQNNCTPFCITAKNKGKK